MKIAEVSSSPIGGAKVVGKDIRQSIDGAKLKAALKARSAKSVKSRFKIAKLAAQKRSDAQMIQCAGDMGGKIGREGIFLPKGTSIGDAALDVCKLAGFDSKLAAKKLVEFYPKVRPATKQDKIDCTTDVILQITADKMNLYGKKRADVAWDACEANQFVPVRAYAALEKERPSLDNCAVDVAFKAASGKLFLPAGKNRVDMAAVACKSNGNKVNAAYTKLAADYPSTVTCVAYLNREHKKKVLNVGESKRVRTFMDACAQNGNQYKAAKAKLLPIYGPHPSCVTAVLLKGHQIRVRYQGDPATKVAEFCKKNGDQAGKAYSAVREALPNAFKDCITPLILRASFTKNPETLKVGLADQCRKHKFVSAKVYDDWKKKHWTLACQDRVIDQVKKLGVKGSGWKIPTSAFVKPDIWHRAEDACIFNKNRMASLKRSGTDTSFMVRTEWKSLDPQYGTYK